MLKWNLGRVNQWKIQKKENLHLQFSSDIPFPSTHRKENQRPKLWGGVGNLKYFRTININEMAAIFQFFIMANADILFLFTLGNLETQPLGGLVI